MWYDVNQYGLHVCALPHLLFHLEPILCKCCTFSRLELPAALLQVPKLLAFLPSLLGYFLIFLSIQTWPSLGYGWWLCPHPYPPRLPSLGVRALQGARHNTCLLLASSKTLSLTNHQPCPGSSSKECCGKKWVWLTTKLTSLWSLNHGKDCLPNQGKLFSA